MKQNITILLLLTFLSVRPLSAQQLPLHAAIYNEATSITIVSDSTDLPILSEQFYRDVNFINQTYDYETKNKVKRLKRWSSEVMTAGYATFLGVIVVNGALAANNDWSLWIDIPCAAVVAVASMYPFIVWSNHLKKKAESLSSQTVYLYNINRHVDLGTVSFTNTQTHSLQAVGIGVKVNF